MPYPSDFDQFLADLPSTARTTVARLKADSDRLQQLTYYPDAGEAARAVKLLAVMVIRGLAADNSIEGPNAANNALTVAQIVEDFGEAVAHRQRVDAGQTATS